jgi:hypothetical protein
MPPLDWRWLSLPTSWDRVVDQAELSNPELEAPARQAVQHRQRPPWGFDIVAEGQNPAQEQP